VIYDCIVVGGGPAGLSAALTLGRARRRTLVLDAGTPRNHCSRAMHGYLTRDGLAPAEFLRVALGELRAYDSVELREVPVTDAEHCDEGFEVLLETGERCRGRALLLATGVVDDIPPLEGIQTLYGVSVHHCPYCDGWEHRDEPIALYGCGNSAYGFALGMTVWSRRLVLCTDGHPRLEDEQLDRLTRHGIAIRRDRVVRLEGRGGRLERVVFDEGEPLQCTALFFCTGQRQRSGLPAKLGARFNARGTVDTEGHERTPVPGLFVAGDASKNAQLVIVAAAEGAEAAVDINAFLLKDDLARADRDAIGAAARST
jgi:thioredoxin reductase